MCRFCTVAIALWISLVAPFVLADEVGYRVGVARVDITPDYPIRLNGFGFRREESEGVSQRIWAKALAISEGDEPPLVLLAIDSLGVRLPQVDEVAARLQKRFRIPRERVALTFSHSHCTPKVNGASDNIFSTPIPPDHQEHIDRYSRELTDRLEQAAVAAIEDRRPGQLLWGVGKVTFAKNRRTAGGPVDHDLPVLVVRDPSGETRAVYVSYACHCVTLSFNQISGDWAGYAQELIERKFPGAAALVSIGCGSDSNPSSGVTGDKTDIAAQQGAEIADEVARLAATELQAVTGPLTARLTTLDLAFNPLPTREQWEALVQKGGPAGYNAQTQLARLDRGESLPTSLRYPIQTFTLGESLHMAFLAGEVCVDYSHRLKKELRRDRLWLNGYSNDFGAYIPSERLVKEGGYGGGAETPYFALPATLKAGLEQQIIDEVKRQTPVAFHAAPGTQGVPPKSPQESLECLHTHDDLKIELVAAEPLVADPVAIDFGPDGRLWVVEMTDYAQSVNDEFEPQGRVRFLTDADHDGRFDRSTEFLSGLRFPTDVKVWRDGVLVCDAPDILFAADTDDDGVADVRKVLFSGFATHNPHARVNSLRWGLDGWLHGSGGLFGGVIKTFAGQVIDLQNRDFRMSPETGAIEPVTGQTQQGRPRDDWDNWFGCTNGALVSHYVVEDHYARRNPNVAPPPASHYAPDYPDANRLYPRGDLVLFKLSGAPGRPTSACGLEIYRDQLLGEEYYGNSFTCEPVNQLVHRLRLTRQGVVFSGRRAEAETTSEFLTSTDRWFRPVQVRTGPDGALWIVDMYRYVIEHPQWIPPETIAELNVFAGQGLGRIYRIIPRDGAAWQVERLDDKTNAQLAAALDSPNGVQRDLAHQLLIWRQATDAAPELERVARESRVPAARVQALATLQGLGQLRPAAVLPLLAEENPEVRRLAVRLSEPFLDQPEVLTALVNLRQDPALPVRAQLAYSLGATNDPRGAQVLASLAQNTGQDRYVVGAVISSLRSDTVHTILQATLADENRKTLADGWLASLLSTAAATGDAASLAGVLQQLLEFSAISEAERGKAIMRVLDGADRRKLDLAGHVTPDTAARLRQLWIEAWSTAEAPDRHEPERIAAIAFVGRPVGAATSDLLRKAKAEGDHAGQREAKLARLAAANQPLAVQSAAVQALARLGSDAAFDVLLSSWVAATPRLRAEMFDALLNRERGAVALLAALESRRVQPNDLDAARRQRLLTHPNEALRHKAEKLFVASVSGDRQQVLDQWRSVASLSADSARGQEVFRKRCATCHLLDGIGSIVGPDLAALTNKSTASLLVAVLDPNRDVDGRYVSYVAELTDGRVLSGLLAEESGGSIKLREQEGKEHVLLRSELEMLRSTGKSAMPEGLEKDMTPQELADVIAFVLASRTPPKTFPGNTPSVITADGDGVLALFATKAEIHGGDIRFESGSEFQNIGYWHGQGDYAAWRVHVAAPGRYDVYFDYACAPDAAGNGVRLEGSETPLQGVVRSTGAWSNYQVWRIGALDLPAGLSYLSVRYDGEKKAPALLDLRSVHLVPEGAKTKFVVQTSPSEAVPTDPTSVAKFLLDDSQVAATRENLLAETSAPAAAILTAMTADLPTGENALKEEYRRIPWIWRVAIAAGKRNDADELRAVLDVSLPLLGRPLRDWQAVVVGGGVINGVSQSGAWPKARLESVVKSEGVLTARWQRAIELAAAMADDEQIRPGTRYDALRMIAMGSWDLRGPQLEKYLAADVHDELQMGAVSGAADMPVVPATLALLRSLPHLSARNRDLALDGLLRNDERCLALLDAIASETIDAAWLGQARRQKLRDHAAPSVAERAKDVLAAE
jgi:putative membrane-bound dehydrogenase-like protein